MLISYVLFPSGFFYPIPITKRVSMNMFALGEKKNTKKTPSVAVFLAKKMYLCHPRVLMILISCSCYSVCSYPAVELSVITSLFRKTE